MHYLSPEVYGHFLWCEHVVNKGQLHFGGLLYVGSNCSYFSEKKKQKKPNDIKDENLIIKIYKRCNHLGEKSQKESKVTLNTYWDARMLTKTKY